MICIKIEYKALSCDDGKNIGNILRDRLKISSRLLNKLKMNEKILVNTLPVYSSYIVHENDEIIVKIDFEEKDDIVPEEIKLSIIFEDEYFLAINKMPGICVHPSSLHPDNTLANGVKYYLNNKKKIRPINRLDKDTSGIVLFAKNEYIQEAMIKNKIEKEYLAIALGIFDFKNGMINKPIARKKGSIIEREVSEEGQKSITHYEVIKESIKKDLSLVKLRLETR